METNYAERLPLERARARSRRATVVSLLGPLTIAAGVVWAILQPDRLTLLHPVGQGFWWLVIEPPLLVAVAGAAFALVVARPLLDDLETCPKSVAPPAGGPDAARGRVLALAKAPSLSHGRGHTLAWSGPSPTAPHFLDRPPETPVAKEPDGTSR